MLKAANILTGFVISWALTGAATAQTTKPDSWPPLLVCDAPKGKSYTVPNPEALSAGSSGWMDDGFSYKSLTLVKGGANGWQLIYTLADGRKESAGEAINILFANSHTVILITANLYNDAFYIYHFSRNHKDEFTLMYISTFAGMPEKGQTSTTRPSSSLFVAQCR